VSRYRVYLIATASYSVEIEADSAADAMDKAEIQGSPSLCHQCSRIDLSDFEADEENVEELS
jgi:hypothetical protein